ncbi:hypothetical protein [Bradyrhizobium sp.]|uniref:hypothetical protein n=1 Tax=Bradyrhizobium sp. TaxID=376 RepID=UPI003918BD6C
MVAGVVSWVLQKKPDLTMILNGCLAGLVGITAGADIVSPMESIVIGAVAGAGDICGVDQLQPSPHTIGLALAWRQLCFDIAPQVRP